MMMQMHIEMFESKTQTSKVRTVASFKNGTTFLFAPPPTIKDSRLGSLFGDTTNI